MLRNCSHAFRRMPTGVGKSMNFLITGTLYEFRGLHISSFILLPSRANEPKVFQGRTSYFLPRRDANPPCDARAPAI